MKKVAYTVFILVLMFSFAAFAADARSATETARALAPEGYVYLYTEKDGKAYEVHFLIEETGEEIEFSVPADETKPIKLETENDFAFGSFENTLDEEEMRASVLALYPDAQVDTWFSVKDDGLFEIHVFFTSLDSFGRVKLNAQTGELISRKVIFAAPSDGWQAQLDDDYYKYAWGGGEGENNADAESKNSASSSDFISLSAARSAVTSRHSGAKITEIELDFEGGRYVYEGEAYVNGREYDFKVDALTGSLIKWEKDD
ncbi:MAG: PepSY domain-containing protein [Clostridia bacterium]|nr:PepSY domain-containing protein [Clostridia bacterium]MBQ4619181.1 PepSY domain-containing protein [Clostridia bacterium]MBQ9856642.1 PepSY domain-containing protein [Clostridia bacterium]